MKTAIMENIKRQTNKILRNAVYDTIKAVDDKDSPYIKEALNKVGSNFILAESASLAEKAATKWLSLSQTERENTLITAPGHNIRKEINNLVVKALVKEGVLVGTEKIMIKLENKNLTIAEKTKAFNYDKGDTILFNRNYKSLGLEKGKYYTIEDTNKYNRIRVRDENNRSIYWNPNKVTKPGIIEVFKTSKIDIRQGEQYASTAHAAQGKTAKNIIGVLESGHKHLTHQRLFYVALSRARENAWLISDDKGKLIQTLGRNTGAKSSATEHQGIRIAV